MAYTGFSKGDVRVLAAAAVIGAVLLALMWALIELAEETRLVEAAVVKLDVAAYQISDVLEEAKRITIDAARDGETPAP